ncbi:MAG TPA: hypothetical protein VGI65_01685 [Steroidobacteraceae bacterium]
MTIAAVAMLYPWLRNSDRLRSLLGHRATAPIAAALLIAGILASYHWLGNSPPPPSAATNQPASFTSAAKTFADASGESADSLKAPPMAASSMESAVANLEGRLAGGGGSADDWELLAKSFEFMGRPADAAAARAHQLPNMATSGNASTNAAAGAGAPGEGTSITGEVTIAPSLAGNAAAGDTLFIIAKSPDSPGPPLAVFRGAVGAWPMKFSLSDSQSMISGRNLSSAARIIVEARISLKGQPLAASGDLQGASGVINPRDAPPLKILIDRVVP